MTLLEWNAADVTTAERPESSGLPPFTPTSAAVQNRKIRLETLGLSVSYGARKALDQVALRFRAGTITALVGPSGCGKSTFLHSLNRLTDLLPDCRVSGSIRFDGDEVLSPDCDLLTLRRKIGMIFQRPSPFPLSIRKNFAVPLREHGIKRREIIDGLLEKALRDVGLWDEVRDRLDTPARALSGGQQQRLCIARALALEPEILLLDEPCSALDPIASGVVERLIASLKDRYTVLVVTHNLAQARRIAGMTALFWVQEGAGRLVEAAETERFFEQPEHRLTRDYVTGLRG